MRSPHRGTLPIAATASLSPLALCLGTTPTMTCLLTHGARFAVRHCIPECPWRLCGAQARRKRATSHCHLTSLQVPALPGVYGAQVSPDEWHSIQRGIEDTAHRPWAQGGRLTSWATTSPTAHESRSHDCASFMSLVLPPSFLPAWAPHMAHQRETWECFMLVGSCTLRCPWCPCGAQARPEDGGRACDKQGKYSRQVAD
jgi:hypothetical protein